MEINSNNMEVEDLQSKQSEPAPTLNPGEAFIQIDSISIDLPNGNGKNEKTRKCEHFSIRKYVSDMRQRDKKVCWPFKSYVKCGSTELVPEYPLPPLDVPKFHWWQCRNCLQGLFEKENGKLAPVNNFNGDCNSDNPLCTHVALTGSETGKPVSEFEHILKLDNSAEKGEADADLLAQATASESHDVYCGDQKEERDDGSHGASKVPENGLEDNAYRGLPRPMANAAELKESHGQEQELDDAAGLQSVSANYELASVENAPKDLLLQWDASHDHDQGVNSSGASPVAVDGVDFGPEPLTVWQNGHPSDELGYPSSDNAEVCPGNKSRDKLSALRPRKVRKVRLLTDLLGQKGDSNMNSIGAEESPLLAISDASEEFSAKRVFQGRKTKRKFHQEDECKLDSSNQEANEVETVVRDAEENHKASVGTVEDDAYAMKSQGAVMKNGWTPHGEDESSGLGVKKRKKNGVETLQHEAVVLSEMGNDSYSLMGPGGKPKCNLTKHIDDESLRVDVEKKRKKNEPIQESFREGPGESRGQAAVDFSHTSCSHNALMGREMCCSSSVVLHTYRNSCMCKKKGKMPQVDDEHIARIPHSSSSMLGEDLVSGIKFGLVQSSPTTARLLPDGDGTIRKGTSLSSYSGKTEARYALSLDYFPASTIPCQHVGPEEGQAQKKVVVSTHTASNVPYRSRLDGFVKKGASYNHKGKEPSNGTPYLSEKQHYASRFDDMGHSLKPQKEISSATSKGEITGSLVQSTVTKNHSNKISKKASARGTCSDDIPMDIVELMAKIQYENSLHDAVKDQSQLETRKSPSYQNLRLGREHENGDLNLLQNEGSTGHQLVPKYVKKPHNAKPKAVDINYSPQVSTNYQIMTQVQQKQNQNQNPFEGHGASFSWYHEKPNRSKRNEGTIANNYKKGSGAFGGISACDTCHVARTGKEPFHLCPSSRIPIAQVPSPTPRNVIPSFMLQSSDSKSPGLKVKNKYEELNKGFLVENSNGQNSNALRSNGSKVQSPLGSSDFYSNDKIPALHLLSLMDAHSGQNVNGNSRLAKQSSWIPHGCPSSELNFGAYTASDTLRHSSSDYHSINSLASGKYNQRSSTVPVLGSSSWFEFHENNRNGIMGQVPLKVRGKGKKKCSDIVGSTGGSSQKYVIPGCIPVHDQKMNEFIGVPNAVDIPPKCRIAEKPEKEHLRSSTGSVWPLRYSLEMGICTISRNPAEFSVPEAGNAYTIGGSELRFRKRVGALDRSTTFIRDLNKPKRGRKKKTGTASKQQAENHHHQIL